MIKSETELQTKRIVHDFPKLLEMRSIRGDYIVLFTSQNEGMVVFSGDKSIHIGEHIITTVINEYKPFTGKIILQNEV